MDNKEEMKLKEFDPKEKMVFRLPYYELIKLFENGEERFNKDASFRAVILAIERGTDLVTVIDELLRSKDELFKYFENHIKECGHIIIQKPNL